MKRESVYTTTELLVILIDVLIFYPAIVVFLEFLKISGMGFISDKSWLINDEMSCWVPGLIISFIICLLVAGYSLVNKYIRKIDGQGKTKRALNPLVGVLVVLVCMWLANDINMTEWPYYLTIAVECGLYFIFLFMCHYQDFLMVSDCDTGLSERKKVLKTGLISTTVFSAVLMLFMFTVSAIPAVRRALDALLNMLNRGISIDVDPSEIENIVHMEETIPGGLAEQGEATEPAVWLLILEIVAAAILTVFVVVGVYALISLIVKSIIDILTEKKPRDYVTDDRRIDEINDEVEDLREENRFSLKKILPKLRLSPAEKIRKLYRDYAITNRIFLEQKLEADLSCSTAEEIIGAGSVSNEAAGLYQKARYSTDGAVSATDAKLMKDIFK